MLNGRCTSHTEPAKMSFVEVYDLTKWLSNNILSLVIKKKGNTLVQKATAQINTSAGVLLPHHKI